MTNSTKQINNDHAMTSFDSLIINANLATFSAEYGFDIYKDNQDSTPYGQLENAAIGINNGKIAWIGAQDEISSFLSSYQNQQITDAKGNWITPGLVDCHTHLVYAGNRSNEFEARLHGASYQDIAEQGARR